MSPNAAGDAVNDAGPGIRSLLHQLVRHRVEAGMNPIRPSACANGTMGVILCPVLAYISGALLNAADLNQSRALYERFAEASRAAGWEAYVPHEHADPVRDASMSNLEVATRDVDQVRAADALIAYVGEPSLGVGAEVAIALAAGKRVFLLAPHDRRVSRFLLGLAELHREQTALCRYESVEEAAVWIVDQLRVRP